MTGRTVKLQSSDGENFEVEVKVAVCSNTIKQMLEDLGLDEEDEVIPLPNVNATILRKVIEWSEYNKDVIPELTTVANSVDAKEAKRSVDLTSWEIDFLKVDKGTLFELILAANYLDMKRLLDITCKSAANLIKGKTPEEIRKTFNIRNDLSPAEEEQIRKENEWLEEK